METNTSGKHHESIGLCEKTEKMTWSKPSLTRLHAASNTISKHTICPSCNEAQAPHYGAS